MKSIPAILAALALSGVAFAADEKPAAPAADTTTPPATTPATPAAKPKKPAEEVFKKLDTNGDGFLSLEEYKASPHAQKDPAKAEEQYKKMDKTGDGKVTLEEFKAVYDHHGKKKDAN